MVAPASANVIGKIASGVADDMLTTTIMAATCRKIIAPAMNTGMLENPIVQDNLKKLSDYGYEIIDSATGYLACGDTGKGKLPEPEVLEAFILREIAKDKDLSGVKLMVTAGPTCEPIDPVRYIANHSTGKMGYAIARQAMLRGAQVTLITGKVNIEPPAFVEVVDVTTAQDMYDAVMEKSDDMDVIVKAAAVADYRPATVADNKIKKNDGDMSIPLTRTKDILQALGSRRQEEKLAGQIICGFSMETKDLLENSKKKIQKKNIDLIAANNLKVEGAGFGVDTNVLTLITRDSVKELPLMTKDECADALLDAIISMRNKK
jgi:phosphopantothenoylcysteine decarboxylase/phosphopantothenate--cysteine ligase